MVTVPVPLPDTPGPAVTLSVPLVTDSVVVSDVLSTSATDIPAIGSAVSSLTLCAPGTVLTGAIVDRVDGDGHGVGVGARWRLVATESVSAPLKLRLPW